MDELIAEATEQKKLLNWEVPTYKVEFSLEKTSRFCIVVPVINEGQRIIQFLERMSKNKISEIADIIIVDGGSTDGSLNIEVLKSHNINSLLLKTGAGKLSAQLLCAYSFSLNKCYEGVITIDGNNKDDPGAIKDFIAGLENGVDFIQGSRFIKGGVAENTPKLRHIAITMVHAPMLSFFSGFKWTDTTQGFRGYSKKLLMDRRLDIFRSVFSSYELLAYISYRAPRLGFTCIEIPTKRQYPKGEIPTKITNLNGNIEVLKILIKACLGKYNPSKINGNHINSAKNK